MRIALAGAVLAGAWVLALRRVDPVPTWFYVFAWYPTLVLIDGIAVRLGRDSVVRSGRAALSLLAWSPVVWLIFEAANLRLQNWYYVNLPAHPVERWSGILVSFATVLPAVVLAERVLDAAGAFRRDGGPRLAVGPGALRGAGWLGIIIVALVLAWPGIFFPLVWVAGILLAEPLVYRRAPHLSLVRDLERGAWGRVGRLLAGGLGIGFLWELFNHVAEGGWIYTVPGLETVKLFEMPPLGFLGFPVFALEAWAIYSALCALGVAVPLAGAVRRSRTRTVGAGILAAAFTVSVLVGMERVTISSTVPRLANLPGVDETDVHHLRAAGIRTVRDLAAARAEEIARAGSMDADRARIAVGTARLVTLRGIGARHAGTLRHLGVSDVCRLARRDAATLFDAVQREAPGPRPTAAEVRVWVRAARRVCGAASVGPRGPGSSPAGQSPPHDAGAGPV